MRSFPNGWNSMRARLGHLMVNRCRRSRADSLGRRPRMEQLEDRNMLSTTWMVNTPLDVVDLGDNVLSLREAIQVEAISGDRIEFDSVAMNGETIALLLGEIQFNSSLTIDASMLTNGLTIDAGGNGLAAGYTSRIFNITDLTSGTAPPEVALIGLTLTGGDVASAGGAIRSEGLLTLQDCTVTDNAAAGGAGIAATTNYATLDIQSSHITGNQSSTRGGGIAFYGTTLTLANTEIADNAANGVFSYYYTSNGGGGIWANTATGSVELQSCTISGNSAAANGGGIFLLGLNAELSVLQNSVVSGNTANAGGGISAEGAYAHLDVQSSRITGNDSLTIGGGIYTLAA